MMKMATGEGFPLRQGAETGLDWLPVATEASGGGTPDLFSVLKVLGYVGIYGCRKYVGGASGAPQGRGRTLGGAHPREHLPWLLTWVQVHPVAFLPKITSPFDFTLFRLRLIFLFFETLKQGKKQELALCSGSIG